jgi:hypothetical protein
MLLQHYQAVREKAEARIIAKQFQHYQAVRKKADTNNCVIIPTLPSCKEKG